MSSAIPNPPQIPALDANNSHYQLYNAIHDVLLTLPAYFESQLNISGVLATDLHNLGAILGAAIESQVVDTLNTLRSIWDPEHSYSAYSFVRQPQNFPDVILRATTAHGQFRVLMGIELKGWYVLAREEEPSFRYKVTPSVCTPLDLLVVYPWALSNVISGSPRVFQPYIIPARYAAEYRNWHWQYQKAGGDRNAIHLSNATTYYPAKSDLILDEALHDRGGNFGRFARTGLMDAYMTEIFKNQLAGIPIYAWQKFLSIFSTSRTEDVIYGALDQLAIRSSPDKKPLSHETISAIKDRLGEILTLLNGD